ncbi:hypothetical protein K9O30_03935 [Clostridium bowmanii]|uniref:hypothetical protein n=1 Tax=Clostridium bowmanii TaxID=132925 RepID=UPI001C0BD337|nr:hypothetical protein [Clostridium bowmanii]MBU3188508.1 hypothetical protein [Clostridium bowmanii]MCA1072892.1 hypothetical protein [Clostridium bowmanii]
MEVKKLDTEKIVNEILEQGEIFNDIEEDLLHELIENKISKDNIIAHAQTLTFGNKMGILIQNQKILVENQSKMVKYIDSLQK